MSKAQTLKNEEDLDDSEYDEDKDIDVQKRARCKHKPIPDWRDNHNVMGAMFKCKLRRNDYNMMVSFLALVILSVILGVVINAVDESHSGWLWVASILHVCWLYLSLIANLETDRDMNAFEIVICVLSYVVQYAAGFVYWARTWDIEQMHIGEDEKVVEADGHIHLDEVTTAAGHFISYYIILIPLISSAIASMYKVEDDVSSPMGKVSWMSWVLISIALINFIGLVVSLFIFDNVMTAVGLIILIVLVGYFLLQFWILKKNDFNMPKVWIIINGVLFGLVFIGVMIAAFTV